MRLDELGGFSRHEAALIRLYLILNLNLGAWVNLYLIYRAPSLEQI